MSRLNRVNYKSGIYFITVRGNNKENIFETNNLKSKFLSLVLKYKKRYNFYMLSYCIMSNHAHMLVQVNDFPTSKFMHDINSAYSKWYNWYQTSNGNERTGHVFEKRYHSNLICDYNYFLEAIRYTVQNPLKANIVDNVNEYYWSSQREVTNIEENNLNDNERLYELLGDGNRQGGRNLYNRIVKVKSLYEFEDFVSNKILGKIDYSNIIEEDKKSLRKINLIVKDDIKSSKRTKSIVIERDEYAYLLFKEYKQNITFIATYINKSIVAVSKMIDRYNKKCVQICN